MRTRRRLAIPLPALFLTISLAAAPRYISLAPSITEILFAVGAGDQVVGVTSYCNFPPAASKLQRVGGYLDANTEAIVSLHPNVVFTLKEHDRLRQLLEDLKIRSVAVDHQSLSGILDSFEVIGKKTGHADAGGALRATIETELQQMRARPEPARRPAVLVCVSGLTDAGGNMQLYVAGRDEFYDVFLHAAGAVNAYRGKLRFPTLAAEGILSLAPEVVIAILPERDDQQVAAERAAWKKLGHTPAAAADRIHIITDTAVTVPGPRLLTTLRAFDRIINQ